MAEWLKAADCKSVGVTLHWFESNPLYLHMGFVTIWICLYTFFIRFFLPHIRYCIPSYIKLIKTNWYLLSCIYRLISWFAFLVFSFNYSEFFIYFFIENAKTPFFIADANILAYHLFQNISFFSWIAYFPFVFYRFFFLTKSSLFNIINFIGFRISFCLIYLHLLSILITHFDIFSFFQSYFNSTIGFWFEMVDYSAYLIQYRGAFFDISYTLIFFWVAYFFFVEFYPKVTNIRYLQVIPKGPVINFWRVFNFFWAFRIAIFGLIFYFFTGEGFFSDLIIALVTLFFNEIFIITVRTAITLFSFKKLLCE